MSTKSLKTFTSYLTLVVGGLIVGFGFMTMMDENSPARRTASLDDRDRWQTPLIGKQLAPLRVHINLPTTLPERDSEALEVIGYVNVSQETTGDIQYRWTLPEGTTIVDGHESDGIKGARPGQTIPIKISLLGFSREQRKTLALEASAFVGTRRMGNSAVVSSRPEDSMEFVAREKMRSKEEFDKANIDQQ